MASYQQQKQIESSFAGISSPAISGSDTLGTLQLIKKLGVGTPEVKATFANSDKQTRPEAREKPGPPRASQSQPRASPGFNIVGLAHYVGSMLYVWAWPTLCGLGAHLVSSPLPACMAR